MPAEDRSGLRGQLGITGELKAKLFELYHVDKGLQELLHGYDGVPNTWDDAWNPVLFRYRVSHSCMHIFQALRFIFDDTNETSGKDWFRPFFAALCAFQESTHRQSLGIPSALDGSSGIMPEIKALMLSLFMNCVLDGARYPDLEWNQRIAKIEKGDCSWRANSWVARQD